MKHSLLVGVIGSTALLVGCTEGGLSMRETGRNTQPSYLAAMYADVEPTTQPAAARRPFAGPARLAVAQVGEVSPPQAMIDRLAAVPAIFARIDSLPAVGDSRRMYRYGPLARSRSRGDRSTRCAAWRRRSARITCCSSAAPWIRLASRRRCPCST